MTSAPPQPEGAAEAPRPAGFRLSEDWLATITGLVLLVLVLAGVITKAMIP